MSQACCIVAVRLQLCLLVILVILRQKRHGLLWLHTHLSNCSEEEIVHQTNKTNNIDERKGLTAKERIMAQEKMAN